MKIIKISIIVIICLATGALEAADKKAERLKKPVSIHDDPIVPIDWKYHKIGRLWTRVTNFGKAGDDSYSGKTPSCDWPDSSGNSYLYRGSLWLTARVNGTIRSTQVEDSEYAPLDSVHLINPGTRAAQETYTRYYDVKVPGATGHVPLGVEITERTLAWPETYRYDFIIYEFTIKNVGIDSDNDGYPDTPRNLQEFYFSYRLDADVSKLSQWPNEGPYVNEDDIAAVNSSWNLFELFPEWQNADHGLTAADADTSMMFMFDGDNPTVDSEYRDPVTGSYVKDDMGNPGVSGNLQSPGFIGFKVLKSEPASFKISKFRTGYYPGGDASTDQECYDRYMKPSPTEDPFEHLGPSGISIRASTGAPYTRDYRGYLTLGPMETFEAGDSVVVTVALGVGADKERGEVYSLAELVKIMNMAQRMVDSDYTFAIETPVAPDVSVTNLHADGITNGVSIKWDMTAETSPVFGGYIFTKSSERDESGEAILDTLYLFEKDSASWPPPISAENPGLYEIIDRDVINGFEFSYAVEAFGASSFPGYEYLRGVPVNVSIAPANLPAATLDKIKVVPNPYIGSAVWNNPAPSEINAWEHRLQFTNLPADATVKIFTLDGDYIDEIKAGQGVIRSASGGGTAPASVAEWDLITRNNQDAAPGIYLYVVQSPSLGEKIGKFVIVR